MAGGNAVKVVLKPFKIEHLEHAIGQALELPAVTASSELDEGETAPGRDMSSADQSNGEAPTR